MFSLLSQLLSKLSVRHILQFLHQIFNVSALLLDNALLKCVVSEVVLFSCLMYNKLQFTKLRADLNLPFYEN